MSIDGEIQDNDLIFALDDAWSKEFEQLDNDHVKWSGRWAGRLGSNRD